MKYGGGMGRLQQAEDTQWFPMTLGFMGGRARRRRRALTSPHDGMQRGAAAGQCEPGRPVLARLADAGC
jgi:hypothetical protein